MKRPRPARLLGLAVGALFVLAPRVDSEAQPRQVGVKYVFQPDCFRPTLGAACDKRKTGMRLDLGPQIAVWVESADRTRFIDTLMVTNAVAFRGIGNRAGHWSLPSNPKFPYGKRPMALPVWAYARGRLYDTLVMQDGADREYWLGFHESASSPDPYFCRPMTFMEIDVDAISCPTREFNSVKGKFAKSEPRSYYPPRNDLRMFTSKDCDDVQNTPNPNCAMSARQFADVNDLDAVSTATPPYGRPYTGTWVVPDAIPDGEYALNVEVSKEFDNNAFHAYPAFVDPSLSEWGVKNNFGQPSVVFRVVFQLSRTVGDQAATSEIAGYGAWDGQSGTLRPPDTTISDAPGSGKGRLLVIPQPSIIGTDVLMARLHVQTDSPPPSTPLPEGPDAAVPPIDDASATDGTPPPLPDGGPPPPPPDARVCPSARAQVVGLAVPADTIFAETVKVAFSEPNDTSHAAIASYQTRVWEGLPTPDAFESGVPAELVLPVAPGQSHLIDIRDLKGDKDYTVGVKPMGSCLDGVISFASFTTRVRKFKQLSGCFIATAAYGSPQATDVNVLRRARDAARGRSALAAAAVSLYERSSPPVADLLRESEGGRALVRRALAPFIDLVKSAAGLN